MSLRLCAYKGLRFLCAVQEDSCTAFLFSPGPLGARPNRGNGPALPGGACAPLADCGGRRIKKERQTVLAGDIWIGRNVWMGTGDLVILLMIAAIGGLAAIGAAWTCVDKRRRADLIRAAKGMGIGCGVTLGEGVEAYFDEPGTWLVSGPSSVCMLASVRRADGQWPQATVLIDMATGTLTVQSFFYRIPWEKRESEEPLFDVLIRASTAHEKEFPECRRL